MGDDSDEGRKGEKEREEGEGRGRRIKEGEGELERGENWEREGGTKEENFQEGRREARGREEGKA